MTELASSVTDPLARPVALPPVRRARGFARLGRRRPDRLLLAVSEDVGDRLLAELASDGEPHGTPERPLAVVGRCAPGATVEEVERAITERRATVVVTDDDVLRRRSRSGGWRAVGAAELCEDWLGKVVPDLEPGVVLDARPRPGYEAATRVLDIGLALVGLVTLALALPFLVVANRVANRGPLLYRQVRVGRDGRHFRIAKLRTMRPDLRGDPEGDPWTGVDDDRITRFGRFLRASHLDELPQVLNVLRGDLAVVGPRPPVPRYAEELLDGLPGASARTTVAPGITGWAQVKYGYAGTPVGARQKLAYDLWYVRHRSLVLDLRIVGRTIGTVLGLGGR